MIRLERISAGYGKKSILHQVTCQIEAGGLTAIIGPNGSGKSTFLKTIVRLIRLQQGTIFLQGKDLATIDREALAQQVSYLPQVRIMPFLSVEKLVLHGRFPYLKYPKRYHKLDYDIAEKAMETMGLSRLKDRSMHTLSGGERQRAYIAMALATNTSVLLLDEPMNHLDICAQLEFMNIVQQLKQIGKTILLVLHDINMALRYADHIILLQNGMLVKQGKPITFIENKELEEVFQVIVEPVKDRFENQHYVITK